MNCPRSSTAMPESTFFAAKSAKISGPFPLLQKGILTSSSRPRSSPHISSHSGVTATTDMIFPLGVLGPSFGRLPETTLGTGRTSSPCDVQSCVESFHCSTQFSLLQIPKMMVFPIDKEPLVRGRVVSEWGFFLSPHSVSLASISHPRPVRLLGAFYWSPSLSISASRDISPLHALA